MPARRSFCIHEQRPETASIDSRPRWIYGAEHDEADRRDEGGPRRNTARQKHRAALQAAIALHGGIIVDYEETAGWWQVQDYTFHAVDAAVVLIRVAADTGRSVRSVCEEIAARCGEP